MDDRAVHPDSDGKTDWSRRFGEWALEEVRRFLVLFFYLWVLLGLFVLNQTIVSREQGVAFAFHGFAVVNALVLAKVMLVFENLEVARWLKRQPVALTILFEAVVCTVLLLGFHIIEAVAIGFYHGSSMATSMPSFGGGGVFGLLIVALIAFVSLLPFFAFKNVTRVVGWERMKEILFHSPKG